MNSDDRSRHEGDADGEGAKKAIHDLVQVLDVLLPAVDSAIDYLTKSTPNSGRPKDIPPSVLAHNFRAMLAAVQELVQDIEAKRQPPSFGQEERGLIENVASRVSELSRIDARWDRAVPVFLRPELRALASSIEGIRQSRGRVAFMKDRLRNAASAADRLEQDIVAHHLINANRGLRHVRHQIESSRRPTPGATPQGRTSDLIALTRKVMEAFEPRATLADVDIYPLEGPDRLATALPEETLYKCISNLMDNAIKYTVPLGPGSPYKNPWISIVIRQRRGLAQLRIENWGVAVTPEELADGLIFIPGYRGYHTQRLATGGTGVGLADVKGFLEQHGGAVKFLSSPVPKSEPMRGAKTTIILNIPVIM